MSSTRKKASASSIRSNSTIRTTTAKPLDSTLYCALSTPPNRHLVVNPVSLNCLDYACKECLAKNNYTNLTCNNCLQQFRKTELKSTEESPLGKQLIKDNIEKLFSITLNQFEVLKDDFVQNINIEERIQAQIDSVKLEIRKRTDELIKELDELANSFEIEVEESRKKLKNANKINLTKYQQFHEKSLIRYEQLKSDIEKKENINEESFTAYQLTIQKMQETIEELKWINPQIALQPSVLSFGKEMIGNIVTYLHKNSTKNKEINDRLRSGNYRIVDISAQPWDLCTLPNDLLLIADINQSKLFLYDSNFKLVKTIDQITDIEFYPMGVTTNGRNEIFIVNHCNEKIYKTDLEFNQICECGTQGEEAYQFLHPRGIFYYEYSVYICDCGSNRIQKYDTNLVYQTSYPLDFSPSRIKIANNIACIVGGLNNNSVYFYELKSFKLIYKYERNKVCGMIGVINSHFYEYNDKKVLCYDETGDLIEEIKTGNFGGVFNDFNYDSGIAYFAGKIILYNYKQRKIVVA